MTIKKAHLTILLPLFFVVCSFICLMKAENTLAYSIGSARVDNLCIPLSRLAPGGNRGYGTCDPNDEETWFDISISNYDFSDWEWTEHCHCVSPGKDLTYSINDSKTTVTQWSGNIYVVRFYPTYSSAQNIECKMRIGADEPEPDPVYYTLEAYAIDTKGNYIKSGRIDYHTVEEGSTAYVDARSYSGYEFQGWKSCTSSRCRYIAYGNRYSERLYDDETVYAVYAKITYESCDETDSRTRREGGTVTITGSTSATINGSAWNSGSGVYQIDTDGNVRISFGHIISRSNDGAGVVSEQYGFSSNSGFTGSIASGGSLSPVDTIERAFLPRVTDEDIQLCDYVGFKPRTWSFTKTYTDIYDIYQTCTYMDGELEDVEKTGERLRSSSGPSISAPVADNNSGQSTNTCVKVHRPWNFKITSIVASGSDDDTRIVYSGGTINANNLRFDIAVEKNSGYFITDIPQANFSIVATLKNKNGNVIEDNVGSAVLDGVFKITPDGVKPDSGTTYNYYANRESYTTTYIINNEPINVPDTTAGNQVCLRLAINRGNSGNGYVNGFQGSVFSNEICYTIAKHPTFQVRGGNFYAAGKVDAYDFKAIKKSVAGDSSRPYNIVNNSGPAISFTPWVELATVAGNGAIKGLASGAATAYSWNGGIAMQGDGNNAHNDFCDYHSPFGIASGCREDTLQAPGLASSSIKDLVYDNYVVNAVDGNNNRVDNNSFVISGTSFAATSVAYSKFGDITINGNITYQSASYSSLSDVPIYIIYAKNINIACGVNRIDAILIADGGTVDTCYDGGDDNAAVRSNQLTVKGFVIADKLILGRTYGAAAGRNSDVPAEIFDLTPLVYLWSWNETTRSDNRYNETYQNELAPRH